LAFWCEVAISTLVWAIFRTTPEAHGEWEHGVTHFSSGLEDVFGAGKISSMLTKTRLAE
jgi:hypothetical protein